METLTKENFWDEMEQKYPKAMKHFKGWIDNYKETHYWHILFNGGMLVRDYSITEGSNTYTSKSPKYHELPIAMQFGIFIEYATEAWESTDAQLYLKDGFLQGVITAIKSCLEYVEDHL